MTLSQEHDIMWDVYESWKKKYHIKSIDFLYSRLSITKYQTQLEPEEYKHLLKQTINALLEIIINDDPNTKKA